MAKTAQEIGKLIHDKVAQDAAAATLAAGMLAIQLEREGHPRAAEAKNVTDILTKLSRDVSAVLSELEREESSRKDAR